MAVATKAVATKIKKNGIIGNPKLENEMDKAIEYIKGKGFGFIKFELEAVFGRSQTPYCRDCNDQKESVCTDCDGMGNLDVVAGKLKVCRCNNGTIKCTNEHYNWSSTNECHKYILSKLPEEVKKHLVFSYCYLDGSVDTELTFTVPIEHARSTIDVINAFTSIADCLGRPISTRGAGMHVAILNSSKGTYPAGNSLSTRKFNNFKRQMTKLMPALYFLASTDPASRRCHYRRPGLGQGKSYAINYAAGGADVLEYRVFETAYKYPERVYEIVGTIARSLEYYADEITLPGDLLGTRFAFNTPLGSTVRRFYNTPDAYESLEKTLPYLIPHGYTAGRLKMERGVSINIDKLRHNETMRIEKAKALWPEHLERLSEHQKRIKAEADVRWSKMPIYQKASYAVLGVPQKRVFVSRFLRDSTTKSATTIKQFIDTYKNEPISTELGVINL